MHRFLVCEAFAAITHLFTFDCPREIRGGNPGSSVQPNKLAWIFRDKHLTVVVDRQLKFPCRHNEGREKITNNCNPLFSLQAF